MAAEGIKFQFLCRAGGLLRLSRRSHVSCYPNHRHPRCFEPYSKTGISDSEVTMAQMLKTKGLRHSYLWQSGTLDETLASCQPGTASMSTMAFPTQMICGPGHPETP